MDPTVIQPAAGINGPYAVESSARTSDQVVVGNIPALRPGFQPRPALLVQLDQPGQSSPVALTGTSGVGKTQLAAAYARARLADNWRLIVWVNARDSETLLARFSCPSRAGLGWKPGRRAGMSPTTTWSFVVSGRASMAYGSLVPTAG